MRLTLFFTRRMSLQFWRQVGMLDRELALYRRLVTHGVASSLITYDADTRNSRSGAEIDLFRTAFFSWPMKLRAVQQFAANRDATKSAASKSRLARRLGIGSGRPGDGQVVGVEINPDCARADVVNCSFDELPVEWSARFRILYSNSFDHSADPVRTVLEWRRVAAPGAYVIIASSPGTEASASDPVGGLGLPALMALWQAPVVFASGTLNRRYHEICCRLD